MTQIPASHATSKRLGAGMTVLKKRQKFKEHKKEDGEGTEVPPQTSKMFVGDALEYLPREQELYSASAFPLTSPSKGSHTSENVTHVIEKLRRRSTASQNCAPRVSSAASADSFASHRPSAPLILLHPSPSNSATLG